MSLGWWCQQAQGILRDIFKRCWSMGYCASLCKGFSASPLLERFMEDCIMSCHELRLKTGPDSALFQLNETWKQHSGTSNSKSTARCWLLKEINSVFALWLNSAFKDMPTLKPVRAAELFLNWKRGEGLITLLNQGLPAWRTQMLKVSMKADSYGRLQITGIYNRFVSWKRWQL